MKLESINWGIGYFFNVAYIHGRSEIYQWNNEGFVIFL